MRCKHFKTVHHAISSGLRFAIASEESLIDAYLSSAWQKEDRLDADGREAVADARARIADWRMWLKTHNTGADRP